jgi:hypothetical protein
MEEGFDAGAPGMYAPQNLPRVERAIEAFRATLPETDRGRILAGPALELRGRELTLEALARTGDVMARGSGAGAAVGRLLGAVTAGVKDPMVALTLPFGAAAGARLATTFAVEAAIAGATTAAAQPKVQEWREKLGLPHGFQEGAANVALAAGLGGAAATGIRAIGMGLSRLSKRDVVRAFDDTVADPTPEQKAARDALEREAEFDARNPFGEGRAATEEHARRARAAETAIEDLVAPRLDEIAGDTAFDRPLADADPLPARPYAPPQTRPTARAASGAIYQFRPDELEVDAARFQFKDGGDEGGVTERLRGVGRWEPSRAGMALVWEDAAGKRFIVDGHQRLALARRIAAEDPAQDPQLNAMLYREADGYAPEDVRVLAALKNIAEGTGTAIDAARVLRLTGSLDADLPPNLALVRDARGLAVLGDDAFSMVVNELVPERFAAIVGRLAPDRPEIHAQALSVLREAEPASAVEAESVVRDVLAAGTVRETQTDLFGSGAAEQILYRERAKVLANAAKRLRDDRRVFGLLAREEARITEAGNVLDTETNLARAQDDATILETLQRLARRKGPVADALARAAEGLRAGRRLQDVTRDFVDDARGAAPAQPGDRARPGGGGRPDEADDGGAARPGEPAAEDPGAQALGFAEAGGPSPARARAPEALEAFGTEAKAGQIAQADALEADFRRLVADGDFDIPLEDLGEAGPRTVKASALLDEIDADREFVEQLGLCLK